MRAQVLYSKSNEWMFPTNTAIMQVDAFNDAYYIGRIHQRTQSVSIVEIYS